MLPSCLSQKCFSCFWPDSRQHRRINYNIKQNCCPRGNIINSVMKTLKQHKINTSNPMYLKIPSVIHPSVHTVHPFIYLHNHGMPLLHWNAHRFLFSQVPHNINPRIHCKIKTHTQLSKISLECKINMRDTNI